jgi:hypothetical protein
MSLAIGTVDTQVVAPPADAPATAGQHGAAEPDPDKLRLAMRREEQRCQRLWTD